MRLCSIVCLGASMVVLLSLIAPSSSRVYLVRAKNSTRSCKVFRRPTLHDLMDRVCLMCHEMFSHERPNMRSECRSNCFKTIHFKQCLKMFMANANGGAAPVDNSLFASEDPDD